MILDEIVNNKRKEVDERKKIIPLKIIRQKLRKTPRNFKKAITHGKKNIIAEIKKKSPSKGTLIFDKDVVRIAKIYDKTDVAAISVVTDKKYFGGNLALLVRIRALTSKPILRKEFIIDEYQIYEARRYGADAILLIARILDKKTIERFIRIAKKLGMDSLVEVHNESELKKIPKNAEIIGINNRNLNTMKIDIETTKKIAKKVKNKVLVGESGYYISKQIREAPVNAILIGTSILQSKNVGRKITELLQ